MLPDERIESRSPRSAPENALRCLLRRERSILLVELGLQGALLHSRNGRSRKAELLKNVVRCRLIVVVRRRRSTAGTGEPGDVPLRLARNDSPRISGMT